MSRVLTLYRFATNTTKVSTRQLVAKLSRLGFQVEEKDVRQSTRSKTSRLNMSNRYLPPCLRVVI